MRLEIKPSKCFSYLDIVIDLSFVYGHRVRNCCRILCGSQNDEMNSQKRECLLVGYIAKFYVYFHSKT